MQNKALKILIIRFSSIGDIVLTTPIIRCLKKQLPPNSEIHYLTKPSFNSLLIENPYIDKLWLLKQNLNDTIAEIKVQKFDFVIDLHNNLRTLIFKKSCGVKAFSFDKLNFKKFLLTQFKINQLPNIHIVDRYFNTVKSLGIVNDGEGLDYFNPASANDILGKYEVLNNLDFIAMAIGGQHTTKKMPAPKLIEIIAFSKCKIVLLGGKEDVEIAKVLESSNPDKIINLAGQLTLNESAGVVLISKALVTHDTGMMHIAAALKKPVIAIWGNTVPEFGMTAYYGENEVYTKNFEVQNLKCRPCSKIGFDKCPKGHFNCMNFQNTLVIAETLNNL